MPIGRSARISRIACSMFRPRVKMSPPSRMATAMPIATLTHGHCNADRRPAVDAKHRLRRIGIGPVNSGDVAQPD
jgi:hypothetical protein